MPPTDYLSRKKLANSITFGRVEDLPAGRMLTVDADGRRIVVYHTASGFFASDDSCPHRGGPLHEGDLMGDEIVCPWHLWGFDVRSGANSGGAPLCLVTHPVRIVGGMIVIDVAPRAEEPPA